MLRSVVRLTCLEDLYLMQKLFSGICNNAAAHSFGKYTCNYALMVEVIVLMHISTGKT